MCSSCGCGDYTHRHPLSHSIIWDDIVAAAKDAGASPQQVTLNMLDAAEHMPDSGQVTKEAFASFVDGLGINVTGAVCKEREEDHYLLMVAYSPHRVPHCGADHKTDLASPRVLEKACWRYMAKGAKTGMWHQDGHDNEALCVENYVYRNPTPWDVHGDGSLVVKEGDWLVAFLLSDQAWGLYKSGQIGGVSMQGRAGRMKPSAETLARSGVIA